MLARRGCLPVLLAVLALASAFGWFTSGWYSAGPLAKDTAFIVPDGSSLASVANRLEQQGAISSAAFFKLRARVFSAGSSIKAGEFLLPKAASPAKILDVIQGDQVLRRFVTIPEGMPSIMVYDRLMAHPSLTGTIAVPFEGTVLPW